MATAILELMIDQRGKLKTFQDFMSPRDMESGHNLVAGRVKLVSNCELVL